MRAEHWIRTIPLKLRTIFRRNRVEQELDDELRFHLEREIHENIVRNMGPDEARRRALLAIGGVERCKEECRDMRRMNVIDNLTKDLTFAGRTMRRSPVFALTAVVTMALGIGASSAIFSVTNAVLLRPLPYSNPDRLVFALADMSKRNTTDLPFSVPDFSDLRDGAKTNFVDFAAVSTGRQVLPRMDGTPEQIRYALVTPNFLRLIGATVSFGRDFTDADGQTQAAQQQPGGAVPSPNSAAQAVILSYEFWQRRFGGSTTIFGHNLLGGAARGNEVVGVLAPRFELLFPPKLNIERSPDVWIAARLPYNNAQRNNYTQWVIARLKAGVNLKEAQSEVETVAAELRRNFSVEGTSGWHIRLEPMKRYLVAEARPAIVALMGAVIFLLLIACANVANLLLVRASLRERDIATRTALGASFGRIVGHILAEVLLLSALGTILGIGLAWVGLHELLAIAPANLPRLSSIRIDYLVLGFTALTGLAACGISGMIPAARISRPDVIQVLRASGRTSAMGGGRLLRNAVVITEVALSFVLLIGSGLMLRSFLALQRINPGYNPHGVLTFNLLGVSSGRAAPQQRAAFIREIQARLRTLPGIEGVAASTHIPLTGPAGTIRWGTEQAMADPTRFQTVDDNIVLPGYFETFRTPLMAGRTFSGADNAPDRNGVIIDQYLAAKAFPNESAIGKRILIRIRTPEPEWVEIIGVASHQRGASLTEPGREQIYFTDGFMGYGAATRWAVRTGGDPGKYAGPIRAELAKLDSKLLVTEMEPMDTIVERAEAGTRFSLVLIGVLAAIAALLAAIGLYGVLSSIVRQRTAEIGVRMALGAAPATIFKLVVGHGVRLSGAGIAVGVIAALGLTRLMTSMLVGVKANDPSTFAIVAGIFILIAGVSSWMPARRAARLDPTSALREE
jgi:predicted permease